MAQNDPNNQGPQEDKKLKDLEKELDQLEKKAQAELGASGAASAASNTQSSQQQNSQQVNNQQPTPKANTQTPSPKQHTPQQNTPKTQPLTNKSGQQGGGGGGMRKVMYAALIILAVSLVGAGAYYLGTRQQTPRTTPSPTPVVTETPSPTPSARAGWETFTNEEEGWRIDYPSQMTVTEGQRTSFVLWGPTQEEGTELFDAISITVDTGELEGETLQEFVERTADEQGSGEVAELVEEPSAVEVGDLSGYTYRIRGLGEFDYYYLGKEEGTYFEIILLVADPTGQGFEETAMDILSTLESTSPGSGSFLGSPTASPSSSM